MDLLEKNFDIGQMVIVNIMKREKLMGHFALIMPRGRPLENPELAVLYASQVGLFLDRVQYQHQLEQERQQLSETKERLTSVLDYSHDAILRFDKMDTITFANQAYCDLRGMKKNQVVGQSLWDDLHSKEEADYYRYHDKLMLHSLDTRINEEWVTYPGGKKVLWETLKTPYQDQEGNLIGVLGIARDITQRKQAEEMLRNNEEQFRAMFEKHYAVMLLIDPETGNIIRANQGAEKYYGYTAEEIENMTIQQINLLDNGEIAREMANAKNQKRNYFNFLHRLANNEIRNVEVHSSPIPFKGKTILFSIVYDVTDRKQAEEALKMAKQQAVTLKLQKAEGARELV